MVLNEGRNRTKALPITQAPAGYFDARPQADRSTKTSCDARPDHPLDRGLGRARCYRSGGVVRNSSENLSRSAAATSETAQYATPSSTQRYMLYPSTVRGTPAELARPGAGIAVRLITCLRGP